MTTRSRARRKSPERGNALKTREKLIAAGRKAFAAKGLGGASLQADILAAAGVSPGSFYHQFEDKGDLLCEILRQEGERVMQALEKEGSREGIGAQETPQLMQLGRRLLEALFELAERRPEFIKIYVREFYSDDPRVRREIRRLREANIERLRGFYEWVRKETGVPLDCELVATILSTSGFAILNSYLDFPKRKRQAMQQNRLIRGFMQLTAGGALAVQSPEEEGDDGAR